MLKPILHISRYILCGAIIGRIAAGLPGEAADWGYEEAPKPPAADRTRPAEKELKPAVGALSLNGPAIPAKNTTGKKPAAPLQNSAKTPSPDNKEAAFGQPETIDIDGKIRRRKEAAETQARMRLDRLHALSDHWLSMFDVLGEQKLTDDQRNRFTAKLTHWANSAQRASFESIERFWPGVVKSVKEKPEQAENYRDLFKALLRLEKRSGIANPEEDDIVDELLGPERVAVPGTPPLTEDAVEAYANMTCFIYEKTHPGKTVDALDNRTVFVASIEHKFEDAETLPEKIAIANFALKWSKFRVMYAAASDAEKEKLFQRLTGASSDSLRKDVSNAALDAVLANGPWTAALTAKVASSDSKKKSDKADGPLN